eukprot:2257314-Pleurochrysis_carterae.AAC.1
MGLAIPLFVCGSPRLQTTLNKLSCFVRQQLHPCEPSGLGTVASATRHPTLHTAVGVGSPQALLHFIRDWIPSEIQLYKFNLTVLHQLLQCGRRLVGDAALRHADGAEGQGGRVIVGDGDENERSAATKAAVAVE